MKIYLGADHAGFGLKEHIKKFLVKKGFDVKDMGAKTFKKTDDYPDYAKKVGKVVAKKGMGILFCGSAEGICIAANKIKGIRAVAVRNTTLARLSREHNDANILCLSGGDLVKKVKGLGISKTAAERIIMTWLKTPFSGEKRHIRRINKIRKLE